MAHRDLGVGGNIQRFGRDSQLEICHTTHTLSIPRDY